jgi:high-affinity Fe2+/Pb2+ permease
MNSEPTLIIGAILAGLPSLVPVVGQIPGMAGAIAGALLSAIAAALVFLLRSKVSSPATVAALKAPTKESP